MFRLSFVDNFSSVSQLQLNPKQDYLHVSLHSPFNDMEPGSAEHDRIVNLTSSYLYNFYNVTEGSSV